MNKQIILGLSISFIGLMLSPIIWWNDPIVNLPLAYLMALPFSFISDEAFKMAFVIAYIITNIVGFIMMHYGASVTSGKKIKITRKQILYHVLISIGWTLIVLLLIWAEIIVPF